MNTFYPWNWMEICQVIDPFILCALWAEESRCGNWELGLWTRSIFWVVTKKKKKSNVNCKYSLDHCCKAIANALSQSKCICLEGLILLCLPNLRINHALKKRKENLKIKQGFFSTVKKKVCNINDKRNLFAIHKVTLHSTITEYIYMFSLTRKTCKRET